MSSPTVGDHVVSRLGQWGAKRFYGYPGDGIGGVVSAIGRAVEAGAAEFVQVRHEETAGFAATADVKFGGSPLGVAVVTSGPGAVHVLNGLYDAKLDHVPVVALLGQTATNALGTSYYQELDLVRLYADVAGEFVFQVTDPSQVQHAIDRAARTATERRTVTAVVLPSDVQDADAVLEVPEGHGFTHTSAVPGSLPGVPRPEALAEAAALLRSGKKVAILAGAGALGATAELTAVADALGAGVAKALLGKAVLDDRLDWVTGAIGLLGTRPSYDLMRRCDTLLMVGTTMPYSEYYPAPGQARAVQIDVDGTRCGLRYPTEVNLVGDARETLAALLPLLAGAEPDPSWRADIARWNHAWDAWGLERARAEANPLNPELVVRGLSDRLADDHQVAVDCGTVTSWFARDLDLRPTMTASLSGTLLSMGGGLPYALAAKQAHPDRPVLALVGDGAMQMNGLSELVTVAQRWRTWADPRFVVVVMNNSELSFVAWEARAMQAEVPFAAAMDVPDVPYAGWAELLGLAGRRVEGPDGLDAVLDAAMAADRPFVLDAVVDPNVPMIPPHVSLDQVVSTAKSQLKGDPAARAIVVEGVRETVGAAARAVRRHVHTGDDGD
ncbi:thiamine pyrophosphate-requiring protein [Kineococcus rhizosphaerae]|uniref:Pyruvate dehydrogenase (Quinone) n=1 Tax=Kineococcus rhizosphaerae TaxID=559628 RepID=A0A2T0QUX4_9ACTN|nr:thiamine pyrophosphate-requiring protein [Kineococcus rhizosphaerae]PRY09084.1 pyruvate dehydrogenase (quinone) [Kineococcus rhizosphaerae]